MKEMSIDRLSALPDSLLIHILSFLRMKEAMTTALLSKRWQFLWTELPRLEFRERSSETKKVREFLTRVVHRTLAVRSGNHLEDFDVSFRYDECFAFDVDVCVEFAVKNKVKKVSLRLDTYKDYYTLPQMMCSNPSLEWMWLKGCIFAPRRIIEWRSLAHLVVEGVKLPQNVVEKIISGCPVLCTLLLKECWGFNCLEINTRSLYKLAVLECLDGTNQPVQKISAPYIRTLVMSMCPRGRHLRLVNIPSLDDAFIHFTGHWQASSVEVMRSTKDLLEDLKHVKDLKLGWWLVEVVSMMVMNGWQLPQSRLECLTLYVLRDEESIPGIVGLLESSPNLETLFIEGTSPYKGSPAASVDLDRPLLHLKTVNIQSFATPNLGGEPMLKLAQILLKWAVVLEKMVIEVEDCSSSSAFASADLIKVAKTLLGYPRSSQKATILLC